MIKGIFQNNKIFNIIRNNNNLFQKSILIKNQIQKNKIIIRIKKLIFIILIIKEYLIFIKIKKILRKIWNEEIIIQFLDKDY